VKYAKQLIPPTFMPRVVDEKWPFAPKALNIMSDEDRAKLASAKRPLSARPLLDAEEARKAINELNDPTKPIIAPK
jgi:hypothetical protein